MHIVETPVLVVGGGLVGLSTGLFLQHHGVDFILIEQNVQTGLLPRSRGIHTRTMEIYRQVGLETQIQSASAAAWKVGKFGGVRIGPSVFASEPLPLMNTGKLTNTVSSPSDFCACPQDLLEVELRKAFSSRGADVRFGHTLISFTETTDGIEALIERVDGFRYTVRSRYLIAADGGRSEIRRTLKSAASQIAADTHYINIFFRADLTQWLPGKTFSMCKLENGALRGFITSKNNATEWSLHLEYDPKTVDPSQITTEHHLKTLRETIGDPEQPVEILATSVWSTVVRILERYRQGNVFFVGDAAHLMPPAGGFNGNTGIADAHNLTWKLAAVLQGRASAELLETYGEERRPVAVRNARQARLRTDIRTLFGIETEHNRDDLAQTLDVGTLHMLYRYPSAESEDEFVPELFAQPGTRFPHVWLQHNGERKSSLDLFGKDYTLLIGSEADPQAFVDRRLQAAKSITVYKDSVDFQISDGEPTWEQLTHLGANQGILVRPDGFVERHFGPNEENGGNG
jgi:putative polyketide hydroxylase